MKPQATHPESRPSEDPAVEPPRNLDAERHVLSACMLDEGGAEALDDVMLAVRAEDFYRDAHAVLFRALCDLRAAGRPTDAVTVADELERRGEFWKVGGDDGLAEIANAAPHALNAVHHAGIVRQKAKARRVVQAAAEIYRDAHSGLMTADELVESAEARMFAIRDDGLEGTTFDADVVVGEVMAEVEKRRQGAIQGLSTGFHAIDQFLTLRPSSLIILAARPSIGKTSLATQVAENVAIGQDSRVLIVSLEMARGDLAERMMSARSNVQGERMRRAWSMNYRETQAVANAADAIARSLIVFADEPRQGLGEIAARARRLKHRGGLGLVVIDYLGLIATPPSRSKTRQDDVAELSRGLKAAARELKVPFLVLCQLNRQSESREDRRPRLADLRESGQIEQDADAVLLLHRPEFYDPDDQPGVAEVIVAKNRNGATGAAKLRFVKSCTRFEDEPPRSDASF